MSNKGNFSQAMREILGIDSSQDKGRIDEETVEAPESSGGYMADRQTPMEPVGNDRLNQDFSQAFKQSAPNTQSVGGRTYGGTEPGLGNDTYQSQWSNSGGEEPAFYERPGFSQSAQNSFSGAFNGEPPRGTGNGNGGFGGGGNFGNTIGPGPEEPYGDGEVGTTIITRNTVVEGNIKSFENIELNGKVKGKIDTTKNVGVSGFVQGDIEATDILLEGAQIKGNINSKGALLMDKDTLLVGDVAAQNTRVDGKIKGEVNIGGNGEFLSNSVVVGNITVSNFYVQYGARMQGYINTNFSKNEEDSIFGQIVGS
ncbi:polymer-forming cytoskeletal protein [Aminipila butyrica]|uniref:Polymer-forming cytoskeletal protein n=1 Tax=Aminipila butyrica TaxID=433296 RepID=A0A858BYE4_9FIRM|nr:polymer-forming cytoskeletal protein [Aminipila butyrica]QIB70138.1 polymer-forming cytoskeletal protein [Aminipila butyrica]